MIELKDYQHRVLGSLRDFLRLTAQRRDPASAFGEVTQRSFEKPVPYFPVAADGLDAGMPYVCLRVPTGGGKTLLACHAAGLTMREYMRADRSVVLWLVPSNTILEQTADALRDVRHPYRRALDMACGAVEVLTIDEALRVSRATVDGQTVVIVATIQAFRAEDTTGRKVYAQNGSFAEHLLNLPADRADDLLQGADGKPVPSLVNMLRLRRPIVIVDEAHNARTDLSFTTLGSVRPACIVEFTATPAREGNPSNVLHHVSAAELKAANMVKLPLRVVSRHPGQKDTLLAEAVALRGDLEKLAAGEGQRTGEYLRPILLIQAENVAACEPLRDRLVADFGVGKDEVKISVGTKDELPGSEEINSQKCPVRVILTVQKLREGWDCPFAYVLCSLKETRSATAIEQIVGRILRLPGATPKQHPDLNCAYVFSVSASLPEVLNELREALENNGFKSAEADRIILPVPMGTSPLGLQAQTIRLDPVTELDTGAAMSQAETLGGKVKVDAATGELTVRAPLDAAETGRLAACAKTPAAREKIEAVVECVRALEQAFGGSGKPRALSPYELQLDYSVPFLSVRDQGGLFEFESTYLLEHAWKLSDKDAALREGYNPLVRPQGKSGEVDVSAKGAVETKAGQDLPEYFVSTVHQHALQLSGGSDWTLEQLLAWLDRNIDHHDIPIGESAEFLRKCVRGILARSGAELAALVLDRFRLREEIAAVIQVHRDAERKAAYRQFMLPGSELVVDATQAINFRTMPYEPSWQYEGGFRFEKHYFGPKPGELREFTPGGVQAEEFKCAQFLDGRPEVQFWVRNLSRKAGAFRLQTCTDYFYPDFVCQLADGRVLVVEYKGADRKDNADSEEKQAIGEVWASRSGGKCLFAMPAGGNFSAILTRMGK